MQAWAAPTMARPPIAPSSGHTAQRRLLHLIAAVALLCAGLLAIEIGNAKADGSLLFSGWESLAGGAAGAPAATTWGPNRLDVFVRGSGSGNNLMHKWYTGSWSAWENLGAPTGGLTSDPAAVAWSRGRIDVFAAGVNGHVWHIWYAGGWSAWEDLGGGLIGAPAVASWSAGRLDLFVRGTDNQLWHKWYAGGWSAWEPRGGVLTSGPGAASWGPGHIDVVVRGTDNAAWHTLYNGGWTGFESLGGGLADAPGLSSWAAGRLDVYVHGTDNKLYHQWYNSGLWSGWQLALSGVVQSAPAVVSWAPFRTDVFVLGTDGGIWHGWGALPAATCATSGLRASLSNPQGALGSTYYELFLTNTSAGPCFLAGYPGVSYVDGAGRQIGNPATQVSGFDLGPVPLNPGDSAAALLRLVDAGNFDPALCQPATAAAIRVFPPGQTASLLVPGAQTVCANRSLFGWSDVSTVFSPSVFSF